MPYIAMIRRYTYFWLLAALFGCAALPQQSSVPLWGRWEQEFTAAATTDPKTTLRIHLTAPSGQTQIVDGFWDGGSTWRVRFMPDEVGTWRYRTTSDPAVEGLAGQEGRFESRGTADQSFAHGPVRISDNRRYFVHADGTPFFWMGDTAWSGALRSTAEDWETYLADRKAKGFNVVQLVTTHWLAADTNAEGRAAFTGFEDIEIDPEFFRRIDRRIDAINAHGLLAAPVLLWAPGAPDRAPGQLPEDHAVRLARYLVARYQANQVVWILGGDDDYSGERADRWMRIGRRVFDTPNHAPVTLHPRGRQWHFDAFADEQWLDFLIYQSGHGDNAEAFRWIFEGPPSHKWREPPPRPVINSEPAYEDHIAYHSKQPHTAYNIRRAVYWSLLSAPTAGVSYGGHGVWSWETEPAVPHKHPSSGTARPWHEALHLPGSAHMQHVASLFTSLDWWSLRPDTSLLAVQPGDVDPLLFVGAARSDNGELAVLYLPAGGDVSLRPGVLKPELTAEWFDPRTGTRHAAGTSRAGSFAAPDAQDWVLIFRSP